MPQLDFAHYPFLSQIFWLFFSFGLLYIVISQIVVPRIEEILDMRSSTINLSLSEADKIKNDALASTTNYENSLEDAKNKAKELIADTNEEIEKNYAVAHKELDRILYRKEKEFKERTAELKGSIVAEVVSLSTELSAYIISNLSDVVVDHEKIEQKVKQQVKDI